MIKIKKNLLVVGYILRAYLATSLAYRLDFLQSVSTSLLWSGLSFASAFLLTGSAPQVLGLGRSELLLLASSYGVVVGVHHWLCSYGFSGFIDIINKGELDGYLLRPFDTITFLSLRNVDWGSFLRVLGSAVMIFLLAHTYDLTITPLSMLWYVFFNVMAFMVIYSFHTIVCTILIWHPYLSNAVELIGNAVGTSRYPLEMVKYLPLIASVWFVPFLVIVNIPTRALLGDLDMMSGLAFVIFGIILFAMSRWFWHFALRSYTGASG